jgi:hypothetical protein
MEKYNELAKKYEVKDWFYVPSVIMINENGEIYSVKQTNNIENLFKNAKGKFVYVYEREGFGRIGGFITDEQQK